MRLIGARSLASGRGIRYTGSMARHPYSHDDIAKARQVAQRRREVQSRIEMDSALRTLKPRALDEMIHQSFESKSIEQRMRQAEAELEIKLQEMKLLNAKLHEESYQKELTQAQHEEHSSPRASKSLKKKSDSKSSTESEIEEPSMPDSSLWTALLARDSRLLKLAIKSCKASDLREQDYQGMTPLLRSVEMDFMLGVKLLAERSQIVDAHQVHDRRGHTAFSRACEMGNLDLFTLLLPRSKGLFNQKDPRGLTPLLSLLSSDRWNPRERFSAVEALLREARPDWYQRDPDGRTALMLAATLNDPKLLRLLWNRGARVSLSALDSQGHNAVALSLMGSHFASAQALIDLAGDDLFHSDSQARQIAHWAASHGDPSMMKKLLNQIPKDRLELMLRAQDAEGQTPLHLALSNQRWESASAIIASSRPFDLGLLNRQGQSPLDLALMGGQETIAKEILALGGRFLWSPGDPGSGQEMLRAIEMGKEELALIMVKLMPPELLVQPLADGSTLAMAASRKGLRKLTSQLDGFEPMRAALEMGRSDSRFHRKPRI